MTPAAALAAYGFALVVAVDAARNERLQCAPALVARRATLGGFMRPFVVTLLPPLAAVPAAFLRMAVPIAFVCAAVVALAGMLLVNVFGLARMAMTLGARLLPVLLPLHLNPMHLDPMDVPMMDDDRAAGCVVRDDRGRAGVVVAPAIPVVIAVGRRAATAERTREEHESDSQEQF